MKKNMYSLMVLALVLQLAFSPIQPASRAVASQPAQLQAIEVPGWPEPAKSIPHHDTGRLSNAGGYTTQVYRLNEIGVMENIQLSGMGAMAQDGVPPFAGNYTMVSQNQVVRGGWASNNLSQQTWAAVPEDLPDQVLSATPIDGSQLSLGNHPFYDLTAGDLNADGMSEQITTWVDRQHVFLSAGEMPGSVGKTTSAPAVVARGGSQAVGASLQTGGIDDYVVIPNGSDPVNDILLANSSFTVSFWAKRSTTSTFDVAFGQGGGAQNQGLHLGFRENGKFTCAFYSNDLDTPEAYTDTEWHHWACAYDAATKLRMIYRDGVRVAQDIAPANFQGSGNIFIGGFYSPDWAFDGLIDQVGIWNVARSEDRIQADMIQLNPDVTGLQGFWRMDGNGDDASGRNHPASLVNGAAWTGVNAPLGELNLLVRGYDQALWQCIYDLDTNRCMSWNNSAGGVLLSAPAVVSLGDGQFDVFAVFSDNQIWRRHWQGGWDAGWTPVAHDAKRAQVPFWVGPTPELPGLAAVARGTEINLFRLGQDNTLYWHQGLDNATAWQSLGGMLASAPGAVSSSPTQMQVFARGLDDKLWTITYNNGWGAWQELSQDGMDDDPENVIAVASAPAVVSPASSPMTVFVRGSDDQTWRRQFNGGWGAWEPAGGTLASGPAAVVTATSTSLFAQNSAGLLQASHSPLDWVELGGLPSCCAVADTGLVATTAAKNIGDYQDFTVNVETGYFFGDGRSQVALAYFTDASTIRLSIYENGSRLLPTADNTGAFKKYSFDFKGYNNEGIDYFNMVAGDFTGLTDGKPDGIDEIALVYTKGNRFRLYVFKLEINRDVNPVSINLIPSIPNSWTETVGTYFTGTLDIVAGDLDGDGTDEIATLTLSHTPSQHDFPGFFYCSTWVYYAHRRVFDPRYDTGTHLYSLTPFTVGTDWSDDAVQWYGSPNVQRPAERIGFAMAAGDVDGDGKDELVHTWANGFDVLNGGNCGAILNFDYKVVDKFKRDLKVLDISLTPTINPTTLTATEAYKETYNSYSDSYQDRVVASDLDLNLYDEVLWQRKDNTKLRLVHYALNANKDDLEWTAHEPDDLPAAVKYPRLAVGDFTNGSLRVGTPTYRVQERVDSLVAVINTPPVLRDIVKDDSGTVHVINTPDETCEFTFDNPGCTHSRFGATQTTKHEVKIDTTNAFTVGAGAEGAYCFKLGAGVEFSSCLKASVDYTFGASFDFGTDNITTNSYKQTVVTLNDDKLVYFGTRYAVWEYPVLGTGGEVLDYITVVNPLIETSATNTNYQNGYKKCDYTWYSAEHIPYNIWSYDPISDLKYFKDLPLDKYGKPITNKVIYQGGTMDEGIEVQIDLSTITGNDTSQTLTHDVKVGLEWEYKTTAQTPVGGAVNDFKANIHGTYNNKSMNTDRLETTNETEFVFTLTQKPDTAQFQTRPFLYWSTAGHIVLDYQADPLAGGADWALYNKSDPAFMLPWYGFPDPGAPAPPPCGSDNKLFSPDVVVDPPFASAGDTVTITASVHNFSNYDASNVKVRFCQGDPGAACAPGSSTYIGEDTVADVTPLRRINGTQTASVTWTASGSGKQKIYAVIDPNNTIHEVHDNDDPINNDIAFGWAEVGAAKFFDMGEANAMEYDSQSYSQSETLAVSAFVPLGNLSAVTRFELQDKALNLKGVGNPFDLVAFQAKGTNNWTTPEPSPFILANPANNQPPAAVSITYGDADVAGRNEANLKLYWLGINGWEEASRTCGVGQDNQPTYKTVLFQTSNQIVAPICKTGTFVLSDKIPAATYIYIPTVRR
jgi:hypothetical protein